MVLSFVLPWVLKYKGNAIKCDGSCSYAGCFGLDGMIRECTVLRISFPQVDSLLGSLIMLFREGTMAGEVSYVSVVILFSSWFLCC